MKRFYGSTLFALAFLSLSLLWSSLLSPASAQAVHVYVTNSGYADADAAVVSLLQARGYTVTLGVAFTDFDNSVSLAGIDTVYLQPNYNWANGDMPLTGQAALVDYITNGGGLVTSEWTIWKTVAQGNFATLEPLFPVVPTASFNYNPTATYTQVTADPVLNTALTNEFTFPLESIGGTETNFAEVRTGATTFYSSGPNLGVVGWDNGQGRVLDFSTVNGRIQINNPAFSQLLSNSMSWAAHRSSAPVVPAPGALFTVLVGGLPGAALLLRRRRK